MLELFSLYFKSGSKYTIFERDYISYIHLSVFTKAVFPYS